MQCHHCLSTHRLRGRPLARYDNTDAVIVPWLSFDSVMRSSRSSSPKLCYSYLVSTLRPFCTFTLLKTLILASWYPVETLTSLYYVSSPTLRPQSRLIRLSVPERKRTPFHTNCCGASPTLGQLLSQLKHFRGGVLAASSHFPLTSPPSSQSPLSIPTGSCVCVCSPAAQSSREHSVLILHLGLDFVLLSRPSHLSRQITGQLNGAL